MGNTNQTGKGTGDLENAAMKGWPILFHQTHSENVQISPDKKRAKRIESFCKGICFSDRPIQCNERVYVKFYEVSTSWSGVVRFGFTSQDPATLNSADLPRYACPDLTNKPGYWAKALPERFAEQGVILFFYVTRGGDVMFGINGEEKGVFFSGVSTNSPLWTLIDIYGNSTGMEFVDGRQLNNLSPNSGLPAGGNASSPDLTQLSQSVQETLSLSPYNAQNSSMLSIQSDPGISMRSPQMVHGTAGLPPVRHFGQVPFLPMPFHTTMGRNVSLSADRTIAARLVEEYCNGYVFSQRPLICGDKFVIQILAIDKAYVGGLAFGVTAADPAMVSQENLPDDSDGLLDRPEYWIVNKDVCAQPEIGDELSFHLTEEGEVRYGKNGHTIATLMHVDKSLPMWAFFDVYGSTQKIRSLGIVTTGHSPSGRSGLTVALPPPRGGQGASPVTTSSGAIPPPRPPPPRTSPSSMRGSPGGGHPQNITPPPSLPPKHKRQVPHVPVPSLPMTSHHHGPPPSLPPPLIPTPVSTASSPLTSVTQPGATQSGASTPASTPPRPPQGQAPPPLPQPRTYPPLLHTFTPPTSPLSPIGVTEHDKSEESMDNASNECSVCLENAVDCVLYTCGHMCMCYKCAVDIKERQGALCPICRQTIKDIIRIYRT